MQIVIKTQFKIVSITFILLALLINNSNAAKVKITKGGQFELCRELKQILEEPENDILYQGLKYILKKPRNDVTYQEEESEIIAQLKYLHLDFTIPKKYKNFRLPKWQDITSKDLDQYFQNDTFKNSLQDFAKEHGEDSMSLKMSRFDLDHDGKADDILKVKVNIKGKYVYPNGLGINRRIGNVYYQYVANINPSALSENFNKTSYGEYKSYNAYKSVYFKGKIFQITSLSGIIVKEPFRYAMNQGFGMKAVCYININAPQFSDH